MNLDINGYEFMNVIILAGGFGTRLSEHTDSIPKPMVNVGGKSIVVHLMEYYAKHGHKDFYLALGYKSEVIKDYFLNLPALSSDFKICLSTGEVQYYSPTNLDWNVSLLHTGENSMTGGRVKRFESIIGKEPFLLTYGDGLSDVDINKVISFHKSHGKIMTVTGVRPLARFGELCIEGNAVKSFKEKPQANQGWINGGFFVCNPEIFNYIDGDDTVLEKEPLEKLAKLNELMIYKHEDFWQCMDTKRDKEYLDDLVNSGNAPWM